MSPEFLLTSLIVVASPGTGVVLTLSAAIAGGRRAAWLTALGCTLGIVPHMLAAITGLAALLHASALAFSALKYIGAAYLLYMAFATLREDGPLAVKAGAPPADARRIVVASALANLLNPKLSIFFFAFLPQFVKTDAPDQLAVMIELSLVFMAMTFAVFCLYGFFAAQARELILARPNVLKWLRRSFAAAFVGLGARLATTER